MKRKRIVIYALSATLLLSGCSLSRESVPEQVIEPVIRVKEENTTIGGFEILKSVITAPSTEEEKEEILSFAQSLEGGNQVVVYHGESAATKALADSKKLKASMAQDQENSKQFFEASLKENPMVQIYYCGSNEDEEAEKEIALYYPNVTYVEKMKEVDDVISTYYRANYVTGTCINGLRNGVETVESFDISRTINDVKKSMPDVDKKEVIDGLERFGAYVENTTLFQKCETFSKRCEDALRPYVEAALPTLESAWENALPYIEDGKETVTEFYEDIKPELSEAYGDAKEYVKSILGK